MYKVLVTGVGAIIGYGIVKSLRKSKFPVTIVGIDIYSDAVGQHWCDEFEQGILASDPQFPGFLMSLIEKYKIDLVIPGIEQDISRIAQEYTLLKQSKAKFVLNNLELLQSADDKWITHQKLLEYGITSIPSFIGGSYSQICEQIGDKILLKPRRSYASKGILEINNQTDYDYWRAKLGDNFMVQKIIGDSQSEYTAGVFVTAEGQAQKIVMQRQLSGEGSTAKATIVTNETIENEIDKLIRIFKPEGPTNFQFRYEAGHYYLLEINPRISSSTSLRTAFGFNESEMCLEYYLEGKQPSLPTIRKGSSVRYIEDWIQYDSDHL